MNKFILAVFIVCVLGGFGMGYFVLNTGNTVHASNVYQVKLEGIKADPDIIRIPIGSSIEFDTVDGKKHIIAQGHGDGFGSAHEHDEGGLESGTFGVEEAYKIQFKKVGIYDFHDHLQAKIHVTVIVYNPADKK